MRAAAGDAREVDAELAREAARGGCGERARGGGPGRGGLAVVRGGVRCEDREHGAHVEGVAGLRAQALHDAGRPGTG